MGIGKMACITAMAGSSIEINFCTKEIFTKVSVRVMVGFRARMNIQGNGNKTKKKAMVRKCSKTETIMKVDGKPIRGMVKENLYIWMVQFTKDSG